MTTTRIAGALAAVLTAQAAMAQDSVITIGTGGQTGIYYVVGQSICRLVNRGGGEHGIRCEAPSTGGSLANIDALNEGDLQFAVAQSDAQFNAFNGAKAWDGAPHGELRAVFSVHPEPVTVVARAGTGIASFDDLKGKRVNVGNPGSGARATMEVIMAAKGWIMDDFSLASELPSAEQSAALCDTKLDAIVFTVGHPSGTIHEATTSCKSRIIAVTGAEIDALVDDNPFYTRVQVAGGTYAGNPDPIDTFGVRATVVSSAAVADETVYQVVKAVFDNFDRFKRLHPAFESLEAEQMIATGNSAPLHPGAARYYAERGWAVPD